ncbi:SMC-Scp complex subunit ScpB [Steroidobacter cummioxidans]|uniref:SMC-Scp complex subunit ScpB n=1 Tax=Steroidobacter cummioxidans TaxID=1803913 RepID=UPI000E31FB1A|nr:SMC-Scp complex subunit ScpB [Steroidobacter cummioxidans]
MNEYDLKHIIEATLLAAGKPITTQQLLDLFEERERPTDELLTTAIGMLIADYENRGIELVEVASGWRIQVRPKAAEVVSRLWSERPAKYSRAFLETLALIAYRQPITRSEIEEIRGVSISSTIMRTLQERGWIRTVGHREVPGRPELLGTTRDFLDYFGLKSLDQLPTLAELKDIESIGVQLELPADQPQESTEASAEGEAPAEGEVAASTAEGAATEEAVASGEAAEATAADETEASAEVEANAEAEGDTEADADADADSETVAEVDVDDSDADDDSETVAEADADDGDIDDDSESDDGDDGDIDDSNDDTELLADADDEDEDSGASSPMVASSDDEEQDGARISEPPSEGQ